MSKYLKQSICLHIAMFLLFVIELPWHSDMTLGEAPIIVDLSEVNIAEMTNLPTKAEFGAEDKKATVTEKKAEQYTQDTKEEPQPEPKQEEAQPEPKPVKEEVQDETPTEVKQDFLEAPVPEKKPEPKSEQKPVQKPIPTPKPKPKPKQENKPKDKDKQPKQEAKTQSNALKSLLSEIDNSKDIDIGEENQKATIKEGTKVNNMGIEGGNSKGSYFSELTITETDAVASLLRQNWQLDPGAMGIDGMIVQLKVYLSKEGTIKNVEFVDQSRFNSDLAYRAVAESARRAVYATQNAFIEVFAGRYADKYDIWNTLRLNFDPLNKGVK